MRFAGILGLVVAAAIALLGSQCGTSDGGALQQMIDAAGPGATVHFPPGVHLICQSLKPLEGQTWELDGAELRRCPAVETSLVEDAPAGATSVQVEDSSSFLVGERVTPVDAPDRNGGEANARQHLITGISGDTITFSNPLSRAYSAGAMFLLIDPIVEERGTVGDFTIRGGIIDGDRRANPYYVAWEVAYSMYGGRNLLVEDMTFTDCWGDCLKIGSYDSTVRRTTFAGGSTAGIHLSGASNVTLESCVFRNLDRDAKVAGHSEGAVTWSAQNRDVTVDHVCIEDIPSDQAVGALANTNFYWNSDIQIYDSQFCHVPAIFHGYLAEEPSPEYDPTGFVDIEGNLAVDAGNSTVSVKPSVTSPVEGLVFSNNVLVDSTYDWSQTLDPDVENNTTLVGPVPCSCASWY